MSTTSVYSIRIDARVRKMIDDLNDPAFPNEIRILVERAVRQKRKSEMLARARKRYFSADESLPAADAIRKDRDAR